MLYYTNLYIYIYIQINVHPLTRTITGGVIFEGKKIGQNYFLPNLTILFYHNRRPILNESHIKMRWFTKMVSIMGVNGVLHIVN